MGIAVEHPTDRPDYLGRYERTMDVSLERMYENTLDWAHLPHLHTGTFQRITLIEAGPKGWRVQAQVPPAFLHLHSEVQLQFEKSKSRWVVHNVAGFGKGSQVWTTAVPLADRRIKVVVDFFSDYLPRMMKSVSLRYYQAVYRRLYDEDEAMMLERQRRLDANRERNESDASLNLGKLSTLQLPMKFDFQKQPYVLTRANGALSVTSLTCPHMLGPLDLDSTGDQLTCPWHGYAFEMKGGRCIKGNEQLRLSSSPTVSVNDQGQVLIQKHLET